MKQYHRKNKLIFFLNLRWILLFVILCIFRAAPTDAKTGSDMQIFLMYYDKKELFVSSTRNPKSISQVAENITVIRAHEIEEMNVHTVSEVLANIPGIFVFFNRYDFLSPAIVTVQSAYRRHVLFLLDGLPWNTNAFGFAETLSIPIGIIERIEVIKGPVSSVWGSALGGVINVITKSLPKKERFKGNINVSCGEAARQDYRIDMSGKTSLGAYYVYADKQLYPKAIADEDQNNFHVFAKSVIPLSDTAHCDIAAGQSAPKFGFGKFRLSDEYLRANFNEIYMLLGPGAQIDALLNGKIRTSFVTSTLDVRLRPDTELVISANRFTHDFNIFYRFDSDQFSLPSENEYAEVSERIRSRLVLDMGHHTIVCGIDHDIETVDQALYMRLGVIAPSLTSDRIIKTAVFINDTLAFSKLSLTAGIRYDENSLGGSFISPSLGMTYSIRDNSIFRACISRGFTTPPVSYVSGGDGLTMDPNPDLKPDKGWSYQMGFESNALKYVWVKTTLYQRELDDEYGQTANFSEFAGAGHLRVINENNAHTNRGFECELQTIPVYHASLYSGIGYIHTFNNRLKDESKKNISIGLRYHDRKTVSIWLTGNYVEWDAINPMDWSDITEENKKSDIIWHLTFNKNFVIHQQMKLKLFFSLHNVFKGNQYTGAHTIDFLIDGKNVDLNTYEAARWSEIGMTLSF